MKKQTNKQVDKPRGLDIKISRDWQRTVMTGSDQQYMIETNSGQQGPVMSYG